MVVKERAKNPENPVPMVTELRARPHLSRATRLLAVLVVAFGTLAHPTGAREPATPQPVPVVIAVVEAGGLNVLHSDYRRAPGQKLRLGMGAELGRGGVRRPERPSTEIPFYTNPDPFTTRE